MRKNQIILLVISMAVILSSCSKLDNYDGPTAGLKGSFIDDQTGELVQQDIINGTVIELRESGYTPVGVQTLVVKNEGTYENSRLFANTFTVQPVRGNFTAIGAQSVDIKGQTTLDFKVRPYLRLKDVKILKTGDVVRLTFKLQQNVTNNVKKIGLYVHADPHVGEPMSSAKAEQELNRVVSENEEFSLELNTAQFGDALKKGKDYFFRAGALIDIGEAKFNYVAAVKITL